MTIAEKLDLANTIIATTGVAVTAIIGFKGLRTLRMAPWAQAENEEPIPDAKLRRWFGTQGEYDALKKAGKIDRDIVYYISSRRDDGKDEQRAVEADSPPRS